MSHEGEEEEGREVEEVGPGGHFAPPHSPLQKSLPQLRKAPPLFCSLLPSPLPQHPPLPQNPPPLPPSPHPSRHAMPNLALPHAPHPQEPLVQHQGLQSFRRWELMWVDFHRCPQFTFSSPDSGSEVRDVCRPHWLHLQPHFSVCLSSFLTALLQTWSAANVF